MAGQKLTKQQNSKENSIVKTMRNKKLKMSKNTRTNYMSGCFMVIVTLTLSQLQSGKINEAGG